MKLSGSRCQAVLGNAMVSGQCGSGSVRQPSQDPARLDGSWRLPRYPERRSALQPLVVYFRWHRLLRHQPANHLRILVCFISFSFYAFSLFLGQVISASLFRHLITTIETSEFIIAWPDARRAALLAALLPLRSCRGTAGSRAPPPQARIL